MKILLVNKYHHLRGGTESHVFQLAKILESKGHNIMHFSMHHPNNFKYEHENFFVPYIDYMEELKKKDMGSEFKVLRSIIYSAEARKKFSDALDFFNPDIIHVHNIHRHLTISILYEANKRKIPVVWTLHDYNLICPNYLLLSHGLICERCKNHNYLAPVFQNCVKDSFSASLISAVAKFTNDMQMMDNRIVSYISPSFFLKKKFEEFGYGRNKIKVQHNLFYAKTLSQKKPHTKYSLYLGRLSHEKGIVTLCEAAKKVKIKLIVAGEGPLMPKLKVYSSDLITFVGYKKGKDLENLRKNAWFVIVPSEWYENCPYSIIESFAEGTPVIGSNIGGIPELVKEGETGFLFSPGKQIELERVIKIANNLTPEERNELGKKGYELIKSRHSPEVYYSSLLEIYKNAIAKEK